LWRRRSMVPGRANTFLEYYYVGSDRNVSAVEVLQSRFSWCQP